MKIAVAYENWMVGQHFGHSAQFKFYTVDGGMIMDTAVLPTEGGGHSAVTAFLQRNGADTAICGGIGAAAQAALSAAGIRLYAGVVGSADHAVLALLAGRLTHDPNAVSAHHCGGHCH